MDKYQSLFDSDNCEEEQLAVSGQQLEKQLEKQSDEQSDEQSAVSGQQLDNSLTANSSLLTPHSSLLTPHSSEPIPSLAGKTVWILDSHAILYQVFHAIPEMTTPDGQAINAVYGMTRDLMGILENYRPDYLMAAFDLPAPTVRHKRYELYKATRKEMPIDLQSQIPKSHEVLDAFAVPGLQYEGYEADDILATVAQTVELAGGNCVLVTADKDSRQLLSDRVKIFLIRKNKFYTADDLMADWGIAPCQAVDFQSMVGDASDNVPGIPKVGPKTATALLTQFGTLDEMLKHTDKIQAKGTRKNVEENVENALLSRELVQLYNNVPINIPWSAARCCGPHEAELTALFNKWGFRSLISKAARISKIYQQSEELSQEERVILEEEYIGDGQSGIMGSLSGAAEAPGVNIPNPAGVVSSSSGKIQTEIVNTPQALENLIHLIQSVPMISLCALGDAPGVNSEEPPRQQRLVGLSLAINENTGYYLPFRAVQTHLLASGIPVLDTISTLEKLKPILENPQLLLVGYDIKRSRNLLLAHGLELQGETFDVMIADALAAPGELSHSLASQSLRWFDYSTLEIGDKLIIKEAKARRILSLDMLPLETAAPYAVEQAVVPVILYGYLLPELEKLNELKLAQRIEFPLERVLAEMEFTGVHIDLDCLAKLSHTYTQKIESLRQEIFQLAGEQFNIDSPRQIQTILFDKLNLPKQRKTQTGSSTDADVLQTLSAQHPIAGKILEYRMLAKLKGTYTDALPTLVYSKTGRIHCCFNQTVTATGRLSSTHPNLQNIPIRGKEGREIRRAFTAGNKDWLLIDADYSQIELRVLAHVCQDAAMIQAFKDDLDIHAQVAAEILNIPLAEVTSEQRSSAKAVNFGIIYGQSSFGLAKSLDIPQSEAAAFIDAYFARFPAIHDFLNKTLDSCCKNGYVETLWGRRRYLEGVRNAHSGQLNATERMAINTVIQGTAADIIKAAMIAVSRKLKEAKLQSNLLIQIHDELLLESPPEEVDTVKDMIVSTMEGIFSMRVPLKVEANIGPNWAEVH